MKNILIFTIMMVASIFATSSQAQSELVEVKLEYDALNCNTENPLYSVGIFVRCESPNPQFLGNHSIYLKYNENVVNFKNYIPENFYDGADCLFLETYPIVQWNVASIDNVPGDFLLTNVLVNDEESECQKINEWKRVGQVQFNVSKESVSPDFEIYGTESGFPANSAGTNFSDETNANKYDQLLIQSDSPSFENICNAGIDGPEGPCFIIPNPNIVASVRGDKLTLSAKPIEEEILLDIIEEEILLGVIEEEILLDLIKEEILIEWSVLTNDGKFERVGSDLDVELPNKETSYKVQAEVFTNNSNFCANYLSRQIDNSDCGITAMQEVVEFDADFITKKITVLSSSGGLQWKFITDGRVEAKKLDEANYLVTYDRKNVLTVNIGDKRGCTLDVEMLVAPIIDLDYIKSEEKDSRDGEIKLNTIGAERSKLEWSSNSTIGGEEAHLQKLSSDWYHLSVIDERRQIQYFSYFVPRVLESRESSGNSSEGSLTLEGREDLDQIQFFPNPATDFIDFLNGKDYDVEVNVFNVEGKQIYSQILTSKSTVSIGIEDWTSGIYSVQFIGNEGFLKTERLVVTK